MDMNYSTSMFIGNTTRGIDQPVFWDAHTQIYNNKAPGTVITGSPGSGKTFLAMTLTCISSILGKTTIVLDPKGDFLSLTNLEDEIGNLNVWNLGEKNKRGILDPFYMAEDKGETLNLVITVIDMFVGGLSKEEKRSLSPIVKDVMATPVPSLMLVTEELSSSPNPVARNLGAELDLVRGLPFAELCFAPGARARSTVSIDSGTTIITMVGLDISPSSGETRNMKKNLSSVILFLVTDFIRRIMHKSDDTKPKTLIIDEAWAILESEVGRSVIKEVALLGRSKMLSLIMITQNSSHLDKLDIENTIKTRFAFNTDEKEAVSIVKSMGLTENEGFESIFSSLKPGECLMQDYMGRYSTVQISNYNKRWKSAFETNPLRKRQERLRKEQEQEQSAKARLKVRK